MSQSANARRRIPRLALLLAAVLCAVTPTQAKEEAPEFEVLVLGTYHAPGMFLSRSYTPAHIRATLMKAQPDVVAVESHPEWFAKEQYHVVTYEAQGVAVPWAREAKLPVHGIDWKDIEAWARMEEANALRAAAALRRGASIHPSHFGFLYASAIPTVLAGQKELRGVDWQHINGVKDDAWAKSRFGGKSPEQEDFVGRRDRGIAENAVAVMKAHPGKRLVIVVGAHHKPFLDIHFGRMKGVRVLRLGKDVPVPPEREIAAAWTATDLANALAYELDAGSRYFHPELVDLGRARELLARLEGAAEDPVATEYFRARIHVHAGDKQAALGVLRECAPLAERESVLYPFPMREWRMRFTPSEAVAIERMRLGDETERFQQTVDRIDQELQALSAVEGEEHTIQAVKDAGFEAGERAADFFAGWGTYLSAKGGMLRFSGDKTRKKQGKQSLRVEVTKASEIAWPFEIRQEIDVPPSAENPVKRVTFGLDLRGKGVDEVTLTVRPAYFVTGRKPLAEQPVDVKSSKWTRAEVAFDLPRTGKFSLVIRFKGKKGAKLWLDGGTPLPVTYKTVPSEWSRFAKAKAFLAWVRAGSPTPSGFGGGVEPGLQDADFEDGKLGPTPMTGWFCGDKQARIVSVAADTDTKKQGERALRFEVLKVKSGAPVNISQAGTLPAGKRFELTIHVRAENLSWLRVVAGCWKTDKEFVELDASLASPASGDWRKVTLNFEPPEDKRRFGVFVLFPGEPGAVVWLDDADLRATE